MRFPRQSAIFRGPLDPAPVVGVLFLLVLFVLLGSLVYTPGVLVKFEGFAAPDAQTITVTGNDEIVFAGKTNQLEELRAAIRAEDLRNGTGNQSLRLRIEPGANPRLVEQIQELFQVQLPTNDIANLTGTDNPTVIVEVNFRGQWFFENRLVQAPELKAELRLRSQEASRSAKKLTMVLSADKAAENEVILRLFRLAHDAGIADFLLAERPPDFSAPPRRSQP